MELEQTILDYWRWSASDLIGNVNRGVFAEFLVAVAVGSTHLPRDPWADYDVIHPSGTTIEVKSCAYIQAWSQISLSKIAWNVRATQPVVLAPGQDPAPRRRSDVWVLALLHHRDQETLDPMSVDQWSFWVVPTWWLNERQRSQHSITLRSLERSDYGQVIAFEDLDGQIAEVAGQHEAR